MAVMDAGLFQAWIGAFDSWERAKSRYDAASATGNRALIEYLRGDVDRFAREVNVALRALNNA